MICRHVAIFVSLKCLSSKINFHVQKLLQQTFLKNNKKNSLQVNIDCCTTPCLFLTTERRGGGLRYTLRTLHPPTHPPKPSYNPCSKKDHNHHEFLLLTIIQLCCPSQQTNQDVHPSATVIL